MKCKNCERQIKMKRFIIVRKKIYCSGRCFHDHIFMEEIKAEIFDHSNLNQTSRLS